MKKRNSAKVARETVRTSQHEDNDSDSYGASARRLDAIIRLLMEQQLADKSLQRKQQVLILDSVGLTSREIGTILGQPSKDISSWLKRLKAGKTLVEKSS